MLTILISPETFFEEEAKCIIQLLDKGLDRYHIRKPNADLQKVMSLIQTVPQKYHSRISLHYYYSIVEQFSSLCYHISGNTSEEEMISAMHLGRVLSISCHDIRELEELGPAINYAFISPIFPSISKESYTPAFLLNDLSHFLDKRDRVACIALGGVDKDKLVQLNKMGFEGYAIKGAVWGNKDQYVDMAIERWSDFLQNKIINL